MKQKQYAVPVPKTVKSFTTSKVTKRTDRPSAIKSIGNSFANLFKSEKKSNDSENKLENILKLQMEKLK